MERRRDRDHDLVHDLREEEDRNRLEEVRGHQEEENRDLQKSIRNLHGDRQKEIRDHQKEEETNMKIKILLKMKLHHYT